MRQGLPNVNSLGINGGSRPLRSGSLGTGGGDPGTDVEASVPSDEGRRRYL
jgi:hypothetical protein